MSYLDPATRARIDAQIKVKEAQLDAANAAYTEALTNSEIQTFTLNSGEGSQSSTRRNPAQILQQIRTLQSDLDRLYNRRDGRGVFNMSLRRIR